MAPARMQGPDVDAMGRIGHADPEGVSVRHRSRRWSARPSTAIEGLVGGSGGSVGGVSEVGEGVA